MAKNKERVTAQALAKTLNYSVDTSSSCQGSDSRGDLRKQM